MSETDAKTSASSSTRERSDRSSDRRDRTGRDDRAERQDEDGRSGSRRTGVWIAAALLLLVALGAAWWYWQPFGLLSGDDGRQQAGPGPQAIPVHLAEVQRGSIAETVEAVGSFRAAQLVTLRFQAPGRVVRLNFEEGERIGLGRILAEIDHAAQTARVAEAEARVREATNQLQRGRELNREGFLAEAELEDRRARAEEARAALDAAEAALRDRFVIAPFDGRVGTTTVEEGEVVAMGDRLTDLRGLDRMEVIFSVPANLRDRIDTGQAVEVRSESLGDTTMTGQVTAIATTADRATRAIELVADIDDPDPRIAPGAYALVELVLRRVDDALLVPSEALVLEGRSTYVYTVDEEGVARRTAVRTGVRRKQQVQILEGLQAGQRIVAAGIQKIGDGQPVRPLQQGGPPGGAPGGGAAGGEGGAPQQAGAPSEGDTPGSGSGSGASGSGASGSGSPSSGGGPPSGPGGGSGGGSGGGG
jgi:membrane fusion protein (multidrug efflux system)